MSLEIQIYYLENYLHNFIIKNLNHANIMSLVITFLGDTLSGLNPCIISTSPLYFTYIPNFDKSNKFTTYLSQMLLLLIGISTSIIMTGLISFYIGKRYSSLFNIIPFLSSMITILIGSNLMKIISCDRLEINYNKLYKYSLYKKINISLIGLTIGLIISPCSTPILITSLLWINNTKDFAIGFSFLIIYTIGYIIPLFIFLSLTINLTIFNFTKQFWSMINNISSAILLSIGTFYLLLTTYFSFSIYTAFM